MHASVVDASVVVGAARGHDDVLTSAPIDFERLSPFAPGIGQVIDLRLILKGR